VNHNEPQDHELRALTRSLGAAGDRIDVERVAAGVLARLREQPRHGQPRVIAVALRIAAMLVVIVIGAIAVRQLRPHGEATVATTVAGMPLTDLSAADLRDVLSTLDQPLDQDLDAGDPGLEDLTAPELRRLLRSLEG
jgi:hypothetical protein